MATPIGSLLVRIGADVDQLLSGVKKSESALSRVGKVAANAGKIIAKAIAAASAAIGGMAIAGVKMGDQLVKTAKTIGATAAELGVLRHAAGLSGVESGDLDKAVQRLNKTLYDATQGLTTATRALDGLGLSAEELGKLPLSEQMALVGERLSSLDDKAQKVGITMDIFGRSGAKLIPLFDEGAESIRAMTEEARKFGLELDTTQSRVIEEASDSLDRMGAAFKGLSMQLGAAVAPAIELVSNGIASLISVVTQALPKLQALAERFLGIKAAAEDLSDLAINATLAEQRDLLVDIDKTLDQLEKSSKATSGTQRLGLENRINQEYEKRADTLDRIGEIEAELERRRSAITTPELALDSESEDGFDPKDREKRAAQLTEQFRTELEKQKDLWRETQSLFSEGLISADTVQRVQDSLLEPIKITSKAMKDASAERLSDLLDSFRTEEEIEQDRYAQRLEDLQELYDAELVQRGEFHILKEQLEQEHQDRMNEIARASEEERLRLTQNHMAATTETIVSGLTTATAALASGSKRMFEMNKKFAKAESVINAYRAIQQVWADGSLPFYAKIAATAVTAAKTAANIAAINSTQFGGGTTPSVAGTPTVNNVPVSNQTITVRGVNADQLFTGRQLIELLNQATKDGAKLVFAN